jgi:4-hydroxy-3-polyprenylbenzoate decarboxylase
MTTNQHKKIVLGITGASGAIFAKRTITLLKQLGCEQHIIITTYGKRLLHEELAMEGINIHALAEIPEHDDPKDHNIFLHPLADVGASPATGSFRHDGMIIIPCSSNTLGAVANGIGDNLLTRAAAVSLKERLPLILLHREAPLSLVDIENMRKVTLAGGIINPINPGYYLLPSSIAELVDFVVGRTLDLLNIEHPLNIRWNEHTSAPTN